MTLYKYTPCIHCARFGGKTGMKTGNRETCICKVDDTTETIAVYHSVNMSRRCSSEQLPCRYFKPKQTTSYTERLLHSRRID